MLRLNDEVFAGGRSRFLDTSGSNGEGTAKIYIKIVPGDLPVISAQLDTGSPWSIFDPDIAGALGLDDDSGVPVVLITPLGRKEGQLVRVPVTIVADEGESLEMEATVFISSEWPIGRNFVGYGGLLQFIRIALDPQESDFYFGRYPPE